MSAKQRRYEAKQIVDRAHELGILLSVAAGCIQVKLPKRLSNKEKTLAVIRAHKEEVLAYLLKDCCLCGTHVEADPGIGEYSETGQYRCSICGNAGQEPEPLAREDTAKEDVQRVATQIAAAIDSQAGEIVHQGELAAMKEAVIGEFRQQIVSERARTTDDFWKRARAKVETPPKGIERAAWLEKLEELRAWRPGDEQYAHIGGYAAYCRMHRRAG